ncbi:TPA: LPS assembly lipoprotein LptE [Vibrio parahaemolyticus]|uniref:LPS-assembly lipoprotein LptE n=1 Tax=Vibrio parahaemolyticus TaxID=670 RepID=UPI00146CFD79|nr:LPS assembly lipoprotein LptE [Vibrio parahaemolyticus]MDF4695828.1 LPS assembly lipoprotein LptE [Vibrio parahaemolyticus]MDF4724648.1 LPS assembly lipoprotein LptE [Vibrio parahaemolyticus]MDF5024001.1 LPS assembly lipoprotein LptE [Vibrio parahaemolyticus]MDF5043337.1 LPS assembly lipoprotein LptE [Vibrio parahaemolyticus]MDF5048178.1 LPS assembly lipoprotein LptE [Vibrio parahaemolyticus]
MRFFSLIKLPVVLVTAGLLSACGFHLRGEYSVPEELHTMSFSSYDEYSKLTRYVRSQLQLNKVDLVQPSSSVPNLHLIKATMDERTLSLYQNSRAAEKELTYVVQYRVTIPGFGSKNFTTTVNRNYLDNPLTALAKSVERDVIEDEMRQQAAKQMMRQLGRIRAEYEAGQIAAPTEKTNS